MTWGDNPSDLNNEQFEAAIANRKPIGRHRPAATRAPDDAPPPYKLSRFDPAWLPAPLRYFTQSHATNLGVPLEMVALQALALPSLLAGHAIDVEARDAWVEPATLYVLTIADSGTGKSPAMRRFTRFIKAAESALTERAKAQRAERITELERLAAEKPDDSKDAQKELMKLRSAGEPVVKLFVTDATDERLATRMCENNGVSGVWSAEPKFFRVAAGAYSKHGPATDVMLQAYSGDEVRVERQTSGPVHVDRPRLTISMMSQRKPVEDFLEKTGNDERGELARFLMCTPPDCRGFRVTGPSVPAVHLEMADECARRLALLGSRPRQCVVLTNQARRMFETWEAKWNVHQRQRGLWREPKEWVSKMPGLVLRLAGVIHMAESIMGGDTVARDVAEEVLARAIAITEWCFEQACEVYRVTQENVVSRRLERLRGILREHAAGIMRSDLWARIKTSCGVMKASHLDELLNELENLGELKRDKGTPGPKGGRPSEQYMLIEGFREGSRS